MVLPICGSVRRSWAKYAGAADHDQRHHCDFVNHSLVVPKRSDVLHRASPMTGRVAWAERATSPDWFEIVEKASPRERSVFAFPAERAASGPTLSHPFAMMRT